MNRETIEKRIAESEETMEICKMCGNERGYKMAQDRVNSLRKKLSEKSEAIDTRPERTGRRKKNWLVIVNSADSRSWSMLTKRTQKTN